MKRLILLILLILLAFASTVHAITLTSGTLTSGSMVGGPNFVASYDAVEGGTDWNNANNTKTTPSITVQNNDVLVAYAVDGNDTATVSIGGT